MQRGLHETKNKSIQRCIKNSGLFNQKRMSWGLRRRSFGDWQL